MDGGGPGRLSSMIPRSAIAALHAGPPAHVYHYKTFTIMVWNHNLLNNLGSNPSAEAGRGALSSRLRIANLRDPGPGISGEVSRTGLAS